MEFVFVVLIQMLHGVEWLPAVSGLLLWRIFMDLARIQPNDSKGIINVLIEIIGGKKQITNTIRIYKPLL